MVATRLYLYEHEYFHHKAESFSAEQEASHREKIYLKGQRPLYAEMKGTDDQLEEALAEAYAIGRVDGRLSNRGLPEHKRQAFFDVLKVFMRRSGTGYRRGLEIDEEDRYSEVRDECAERILSSSPAPQR